MPDSYGSMGDEETKSFMEKVKKMRVKEERRNLAKAVLITESIRERSVGEAKGRGDHQEVRRLAAYTPLTRSLLEG